MNNSVLSSPANPRIKSLVALRNRRDRERTGTTRVEGLEELSTALDARVVPRALYHCPELTRGRPGAPEVVTRVRHTGAQVIECSRAAFEKAAYREGPDGILAVVDAPGMALANLNVAPGALLLVAQGIEKPGNLGAMLRTADAAGVGAVIAADPRTDWGNPNVIRASKGTVFTVPVASGTTAQALAWLAQREYAIVATTPEASALHTETNLTGPVAVAVGTEKDGLDAEFFAAATTRVRIPMAGRADSLNAATAAAIVLFEAVRQRG